MKRTIATLLAGVMCLCFLAGCAPREEPEQPDLLKNTAWRTQIDMTGQAANVLAGMEATIGPVTPSPFELELVLTFGDGTYEAKVDEASLAKAMETLLSDIRGGVEAKYKALADPMQLTVEEYLAIAGTSMDKIMGDMEKMLTDAQVEQQFARLFAGKGTYRWTETVLTLENFLQCKYTLSEKTLTLTQPFVGMDTLQLQKQ